MTALFDIYLHLNQLSSQKSSSFSVRHRENQIYYKRFNYWSLIYVYFGRFT
jgi:hypothetical protein